MILLVMTNTFKKQKMDAFEQKNHKAQILETIDKKSTSHISGKHFTHFLPFSLDLKKM